ncbi:MAG TPA: GyrI-like domain-containing protein [Jatrophihabitans sp.]|nr:GyrI-like domain-containing protein [Jatrophihabitans sp.]
MTRPSVDRLAWYRGRQGRVDILDLPELGYLAVSGSGSPGESAFADARQALLAVSAAVRLVVRNEYGAIERAMPLEAQWWVDDPWHLELVAAVALGHADGDSRRKWRAMVLQPELADEHMVEKALKHAGRRPLPGLQQVRFLQWAEGRCAQVLHVGRRVDEEPTVWRLHSAIAAAGYEPTGRAHEIYLSDPRRATPANLRTLLRQPISPLPAARR